MKKSKRWMQMNRVLLVTLGLLLLFAWMDTRQIIAMKTLDGAVSDGLVWEVFWGVQLPAVNALWFGVLAAIGLIWYLLYKDKSEALAIFATPALLIWFGVQDLIYFVFSPIDGLMTHMGCWADRMMPVRIISDILGETCPSALAMVISAIIGIALAYLVYRYLQKKKEW